MIIVSLEVLFIAIILIAKSNNKPSIFHYSLFVIVSESMEPMINVGDVIIVTNNINELEIGDVVTYKRNGIYITHMIIDLDDKYVITKGINNNISDEKIRKEDVLYKYIKKSKTLSFLYRIINNIVFKIVFIILLLSFLFNNVFEIIKYRKLVKK